VKRKEQKGLIYIDSISAQINSAGARHQELFAHHQTNRHSTFRVRDQLVFYDVVASFFTSN
jgi:hypothetical protein